MEVTVGKCNDCGRMAYRHGDSPATHEEGRDGRDRQRQEAREIRRSAHRIQDELNYVKVVIREHIDRGTYWDPRRRTLPTEEWSQHRDALTRDPTFDKARTLSGRAYHQIDRVNHTVERRTLSADSMSIRSSAHDGLDDALLAIEEAAWWLDNAIDKQAPKARG